MRRQVSGSDISLVNAKQGKEVKQLKKVWVKPTIVTYKEDELLNKASLRAQSIIHADHLEVVGGEEML